MFSTQARIFPIAAGFCLATFLSACGDGTSNEVTSANMPASPSGSASSPTASPTGASRESAYCDEAPPSKLGKKSKKTKSIGTGYHSSRVADLVLKLQPSQAGANDTNDASRVDAVLRRALAAAATSAPDNPFASAGAQAAVRFGHLMSDGAAVIVFGLQVEPADAAVLVNTLALDSTVDYAELDKTEYDTNETEGLLDATDNVSLSSKAAAVGMTGTTVTAAADIANTASVANIAIASTTAAPNDKRYPKQWNLDAADVGLNMPAAWALQKANPTVITAIIDSGYEPHKDLDGNRLSTGLTMLASRDRFLGLLSGIINTDAIDLSNTILGGHGTAVAGTMSAVTNDATGVAGVGWNAKFVPINVFSDDGFATDSDIADAVRWAAGIPVPNTPVNAYPAKIINLSLGGQDKCRKVSQRAIDDVVAKGVSVVVAAGNENTPASWSSPANCNNVITVAGTNAYGQRFDLDVDTGSNYGRAVTVSAPGEDILTTTTDVGLPKLKYNYWTGTSFAAPQVTGVVALMLSANPNLTPAQVKQILQDTAKKPKLGNNEQLCTQPEGAGIVDAGAAVLAAKSLL